jgi:predicted HTH transcriptional regulator
MQKVDIETLLQSGEFRNLDFKETHPLDGNAKREITKDLMAFSNIPDGGRIIIGVKEKKGDITEQKGMHYELTGMDPGHLSTWIHDHLADFAKNHADPYVEFEFQKVLIDKNYCLVIRIKEFEEIPVVCKKDSGNTLRCGAIYTRTQGKRESAEVRSQTEAREILDLAVQKRFRKIVSTAEKVGVLRLLQSPLIGQHSDSEKFRQQREEF